MPKDPIRIVIDRIQERLNTKSLAIRKLKDATKLLNNPQVVKDLDVADIAGELERKLNAATADAQRCITALEVVRDICRHDWEPDGNDSHHSYRKCTICLLREEA